VGRLHVPQERTHLRHLRHPPPPPVPTPPGDVGARGNQLRALVWWWRPAPPCARHRPSSTAPPTARQLTWAFHRLTSSSRGDVTRNAIGRMRLSPTLHPVSPFRPLTAAPRPALLRPPIIVPTSACVWTWSSASTDWRPAAVAPPRHARGPSCMHRRPSPWYPSVICPPRLSAGTSRQHDESCTISIRRGRIISHARI